jgi:hypothetical protein
MRLATRWPPARPLVYSVLQRRSFCSARRMRLDGQPWHPNFAGRKLPDEQPVKDHAYENGQVKTSCDWITTPSYPYPLISLAPRSSS